MSHQFRLQAAVEYFNGQNDEKYTFYTERIQNTLLRPEVMSLMNKLQADPAAYKRELQEQEEVK